MMMFWSRNGFIAMYVIVFYVLAPSGLAGRHSSRGLLSGLGDSSVLASPAEYDATVKQLWLDCGLDMEELKAAVEKLDSSLLDILRGSSEIDPRKWLLEKGNIEEVIAHLSPEMKDTLVVCLNKKSSAFRASGNKGHLRIRYSDFFESLLRGNPATKRHLSEQISPTVAPGPSPAPAPAHTHASPPPPHYRFHPSAFRRSPPPALGPSSLLAPPPHSFYSSGTDDTVFASDVPSEEPSDSKAIIIVAIVSTAVGTFLFSAILFVCCNRCQRKSGYSRHGQRDDRPLLSLRLSDLSGSSQKSLGQGNSINKEKFGDSSFKMDQKNQTSHVSPVTIGSANAPASELHLVASKSSNEPSNAPSKAPPPKAPPPPVKPPPPPPKPAPPPPAAPPRPPNKNSGGPPPPPPKAAFPSRPPQASPISSKARPPAPPGPRTSGDPDMDAPKTKLKPLFWDKVLANSDQTMVWDQLKSGSFQVDEDMIESLFGYNSADKLKSDGKKELSLKDSASQYIRILEPKKSQNLAISLKALNVKVEEVCDALTKGNELPAELLQTLLRMAPTSDEELRLRLYTGDTFQLGTAEQFMKALVDIPFAFQRLDALLFMISLPEELSSTKESFSTLELACKELKSSRLFLKLLEAVLKTGNRMNDGTYRGGAQAFKLDTLLKLADVKGADGKTTLLQFVVLEIIRSEGVRAARVARESASMSSVSCEDLTDDVPQESEDYFKRLGLKVVSGVGDQLENVKRAAGFDADALTSTVATLGHRLLKTKEFLKKSAESMGEESQFHRKLTSFAEQAEVDITLLLGEEKRTRSLIKNTIDYFHGNAGKDEGLRIFVIVRDFLTMIDKTCKQVREAAKQPPKPARSREPSVSSPSPDPRQLLFPAIRDRRVDSSSSDSSDDES